MLTCTHCSASLILVAGPFRSTVACSDVDGCGAEWAAMPGSSELVVVAESAYHFCDYDEPDLDFAFEVESSMASAGFGTDEDYGYYGGEDY